MNGPVGTTVLEIPPREFLGRQKRAVDAARERGLDALLIWSRGGPGFDGYGDVFYLTNHFTPFPVIKDSPLWTCHGYSVLVLPVEDEPTLVVDIFDYPPDRVYISDVRPTRYVPETVADVLIAKGLGGARIGLIGQDSLLAHAHHMITERLGPKAVFQTAEEILIDHRLVKSDHELALIRHATSLGREWMTTMMETIEAGKTQADVVAEGLRAFVSQGGYPYDVAITSGPEAVGHNWARVGIPSFDWEKPLKRGDLIKIDAWGPVLGYYTDFTRSTVVGGEPTTEQLSLLEAPIDLVQAILDEVSPGRTIGELYETGTEWLQANGFGEFVSAETQRGNVIAEMVPTFGHSLGLAVEPPYIHEGEPTVLVEGMVLAVEAFLDREGLGLTGFEHNLVVTSEGCEVLTEACPSKWWEL